MTARRSLLRVSGITMMLLAIGAGAVATTADDWRRVATLVAGHLDLAAAAIAASYERSPAMVLGLAASIVLPAAALIAGIARHVGRQKRRLREMERLASLQQPVNPGFTLRPAWLIVDGADQQRVPIDRELVSIGRDQDNDLWFADPTVHRHHAVVQRTPEAGFEITDVSGPSGQGIRVNGARIVRARLTAGDQIQIGRVKLTFARDRSSRAGTWN